MRRQVIASVREIIRQGIGDLTVYAFASGLSVDMLAAAGLLKRYEGVYVGLFWHGFAPNFRRAVEAGTVEVRDFSESSIVARFQAACIGASFMPVKAILGTDMAAQDPIDRDRNSLPVHQAAICGSAGDRRRIHVMHGYAPTASAMCNGRSLVTPTISTRSSRADRSD